MKSTEILDLMINDHNKIIKLINNLEKSLDLDQLPRMKVYDILEWELEKHIFTEEKAIFTLYNPEDAIQGYKMMPELIKEHNEILNTLQVIRRALIKKVPCNIQGFKEILMKHKTFEEVEFYPNLDQVLEESQKMIIINRIKEIV